jgi:hypothetical protein
MSEPARPRPPVPLRPSRVALRTDDGALAIADVDGGAEIVRTALDASGDVDLAFDPADGSIVAYTEGEDGGGELRRFPLSADASAIDPPVKISWIDGTARLLPVAAGLVVFEENVGARWKLLGPAGAVPSVACPRPSSIVALDAGPHTRVEGLARVDGAAWSHVSARVDATGFDGCADVPLPDLGLASARLVGLSGGRELAAGVAGGLVAFRTFPLEAGALSTTGAPATAAGSAVALEAGDRELVAVLASGPSALVVFDPNASADPSFPARAIALPGDVRLDDKSLSRDLVAFASPPCDGSAPAAASPPESEATGAAASSSRS